MYLTPKIVASIDLTSVLSEAHGDGSCVLTCPS